MSEWIYLPLDLLCLAPIWIRIIFILFLKRAVPVPPTRPDSRSKLDIRIGLCRLGHEKQRIVPCLLSQTKNYVLWASPAVTTCLDSSTQSWHHLSFQQFGRKQLKHVLTTIQEPYFPPPCLYTTRAIFSSVFFWKQKPLSGQKDKLNKRDPHTSHKIKFVRTYSVTLFPTEMADQINNTLAHGAQLCKVQKAVYCLPVYFSGNW
jgi:hypothetical protein